MKQRPLKRLLNAPQFVFARGEEPRCDRNTYFIEVGHLWVHTEPTEGERLGKKHYYGFLWRLAFRPPIEEIRRISIAFKNLGKALKRMIKIY